MYNKEIYQKLLEVFGEPAMGSVTDIISTMYDIKYNASKIPDMMNEYDYERQWWSNKHKEILTKLEK